MSKPRNELGEYNYKAFTSSESAGKSAEFRGSIPAGKQAPDFELATVEGKRMRLSEFRGNKHVLLEFGSIT